MVVLGIVFVLQDTEDKKNVFIYILFNQAYNSSAVLPADRFPPDNNIGIKT